MRTTGSNDYLVQLNGGDSFLESFLKIISSAL